MCYMVLLVITNQLLSGIFSRYGLTVQSRGHCADERLNVVFRCRICGIGDSEKKIALPHRTKRFLCAIVSMRQKHCGSDGATVSQ